MQGVLVPQHDQVIDHRHQELVVHLADKRVSCQHGFGHTHRTRHLGTELGSVPAQGQMENSFRRLEVRYRHSRHQPTAVVGR